MILSICVTTSKIKIFYFILLSRSLSCHLLFCCSTLFILCLRLLILNLILVTLNCFYFGVLVICVLKLYFYCFKLLKSIHFSFNSSISISTFAFHSFHCTTFCFPTSAFILILHSHHSSAFAAFLLQVFCFFCCESFSVVNLIYLLIDQYFAEITAGLCSFW